MMDYKRRAQCSLTIMQQIGELKNWHKQQQKNVQQSKSETKSDNQNDNLLPVNANSGVCDLKCVVKNQDPVILGGTLLDKQKTKECDSIALKNETKEKICVNFDELPIFPKNTDFDKLVENSIRTSNLSSTSSVQTTKHKFLKKGEGTARFRMAPPKPQKKYSVNDTKKASEAKPNNFDKNQVIEYTSDVPSAETDINNKNCSENHKNSVKSPKSQEQTKTKCTSWKTLLTSVSQSPKSSDELLLNVSADSVMLSFIEKIIALDEASKRECEELKIFELLEQRALDSSFSSNSSVYTRLMENSIKSTPVKYKPSSDTVLGDTECINSLSKHNKNTVNTNVCSSSVGKNSFNMINNGGIRKQDVERSNSLPSDNDDKDKSLHVHFAENDSYRSFENEKSDSKECSEMRLYGTEYTNPDFNSFGDCEEWSGGDCLYDSTEYSSSEEDCRPVSPPSPVPQSSDKSSNANKTSTLADILKVEGNENSDYRVSCVTNSNVANEETNNPDCDRHETQLKPVDINTKTDDVIRRSVIEARLQELEKEIETFRSENNKLRKLRSEYDQEYKKFQNEKNQFLKQLNEEKSKIAADLEESKRKLAKEKLVHEKYSKTVSKNANKQERAEILALKQKLTELQEEMKKKESRWGASQARVRNQMRQLEEDNKKLKGEIERIKKMSTCNHHVSSHRIQENPISNTQLIHVINKQLSNLGFKYIFPDFEEDSSNYSKQIKKIESRKFLDHNKNAEELRTGHKDFTKFEVSDNSQVKARDTGTNSEDENDFIKNTVYTATFKQVSGSENSVLTADKHEVIDTIDKNVPENEEHTVNYKAVREILIPDGEKVLKEMVFPDGRKEIYYPNGNTKKISPNGDVTKIIYFNGDVKETNDDGTIKYYYAESKVWHTTYPDGLEVLDYPNGLVEQRCKNGTVNVMYPNGSKKYTYPDSSEEWIYPDGSTMKINLNNDKVLTLPNGQKEFHTREHMRREYPDGTVKFVYPDGTQETRYSNGRIRLKDKSGNLVMDSGNM